MLLETKNLYKSFGELVVVDHLNFDVKQGEIVGIAGPNGAGKTTLFNVITGFYPATGEITFNNANILGLKPHQICHRGIARTFQITQVFLTLPVRTNVEVGAHFGTEGKHDEEQIIKEIISFMGLQGKEDIIASHLNYFDKKLTMLASALATKPRLLLLDEPASGLSPSETLKFIESIKKINRELGITIIIIEHIIKVLTDLCNRLMFIDNGQQIAIGPPQEVAQDPRVVEIYLGGSAHAGSK